MKTTQLYRKHNGVLALRYVTMMLIRFGVILSFVKISWKISSRGCVVIVPETFTAPALSVGVKNDFD